MEQESDHLGGGWEQEGDQEKPNAVSVEAGVGTVTQTDEPTQKIWRILTTGSR